MFERGLYRTRLAETAADLREAQRLRHLAFRARAGAAGAHGGQGVGGAAGADGAAGGLDADDFDALCTHFLVEERAGGRLVCCFRLLALGDGRAIGRSYSAQFYELSALSGFAGPMAELGRFCIRPGLRDPDILRAAWAALTRHVDANGIEMLFGCSSFPGTDAAPYTDVFALLGERHLAPRRWRVRVKAPAVVRFARRLRRYKPDMRLAMRRMPPLLRSYLAMGGWVSDHAVVDADMNTLHVFTGLEIAAMPPARKRLLRVLAG
ncbi:MAG: GNAT family N-acetyltransferase [Roseovarius sp.]